MHKLNNKLNNFTSVTKILLVNKNKQTKKNKSSGMEIYKN